MSGRSKLFGELYQLAGGLLLADEEYTEGMRARLRELLLNALSEPQRYTARQVRIERELAVKP